MKNIINLTLHKLFVNLQTTLLVMITLLCAPLAMAQVDTNAWYVLVNRHSGMAMDIHARSTAAGAQLVQWTRNDGNNQQFRFVSSGSGYHRILARHSGMVLDVHGWNADDGADIVQWQDLNGHNQQFLVDDMGGGYVRLVNRFSSKALDNWGWSTQTGTRISQYTPSTAAVQQWQLVRVGNVSNGGSPTACGQGSSHATVTGSAGNYQVNGNNAGSNYVNAINTALNSLTPGRNSPQRVTVFASGSLGSSAINLPSNTIFEVCGTMNVGAAGNGGSIRAIGVQNVSIPHLTMTGNPYFGLQFGDIHNLHLGQIDLRLSGGLGIRFDRDRPANSNVQIDHVYVSGTNNHGVETWNVDGLEIGTVIARNTGYSGLLLNNTRNAVIGLVDGQNTGAGTGYATLRFANTNGRIGSAYPTNIVVDRVISRGGGRGVFCVSNSGGVRINSVDLASNGNNSILIENCHNVDIRGGTVNGGGEVRLAARTEFPNNSNIRIANLRVTNTSVRENPCGNNVTWSNVTVQGGSYNVCN